METDGEIEVDTETLISGALSRGLMLRDFKELTVGQIVEYCITYNLLNRETNVENSNEEKTKIATQQDFDNF